MARFTMWKTLLPIFCILFVFASSVDCVDDDDSDIDFDDDLLDEDFDDSFDDEEDSPDAVPFDDEDDEMSEEDEDTMFADMEEGIVDSDTRVTKEKTAEDFPEGKGLVIPEGVHVKDGVLVLDEKNFDEVVFNAEIILVEFYAPWCGHCKTLEPEFASAALTFADMKSHILLGKVDATENKDLAERFGVSGYPTLYYWREGQRFDYDGERKQNDIMEYMIDRAKPDWKPPPEAVVTLTSDNFAEIVDDQELLLVEFYAPWCGHCKKLAPEFEKAAKQLAQMEKKIMLAKVDATVETDLAERFNVQGYPVLKIFRYGIVYEYNGGRETNGIISYMLNQLGEGSKHMKDKLTLQSFMKNDDVTVIGFFDSRNDDVYNTYIDACNELRDDYTLGHTFDAELRKQYKVNTGTVVVFNSPRFYTKYEPKWHTLTLTDKSMRKDVTKFVEQKQIPLVGHMNKTQEKKRYKTKRPLVVVFYAVDFSHDHKQATQLWRNKIADIASDYKSLTFTIADEDEMEELFNDFGFDESAEEMNIGIVDGAEKKFPMEEMEEFDSDMIRDFLDSYKNGDLKPRIKSKPPPKKQGVVKIVVGSTFEKIVLDKSKDVLIELYAPWCGHCKKLEPVIKELAKKYTKDKNLVIAKMDATANDPPTAYPAGGYPTIYFAPADNKNSPVKYDGTSREVKDLEDFMKKYARASSLRAGKEEL